MKLNFNFEIKDSRGRKVPGGGKSTMLDILDTAGTNDEKILDKIKYWTRDISKDGALDIDVPDAKDLKSVVISSRMTHAFAKITLKDYIQDNIERHQIKDDNENKTDGNRATRRRNDKNK